MGDAGNRFMKRIAGIVFSGVVALALLLAVGCGRDVPPPAEIVDAEQAAPEVVEAFSGAEAELQEEVVAAAEALRAQQDEDAFLRLEALSTRGELTPEQRAAAHQAWLAAHARLQAAASNGNSSAEAALNDYRSRK